MSFSELGVVGQRARSLELAPSSSLLFPTINTISALKKSSTLSSLNHPRIQAKDEGKDNSTPQLQRGFIKEQFLARSLCQNE